MQEINAIKDDKLRSDILKRARIEYQYTITSQISDTFEKWPVNALFNGLIDYARSAEALNSMYGGYGGRGGTFGLGLGVSQTDRAIAKTQLDPKLENREEQISFLRIKGEATGNSWFFNPEVIFQEFEGKKTEQRDLIKKKFNEDPELQKFADAKKGLSPFDGMLAARMHVLEKLKADQLVAQGKMNDEDAIQFAVNNDINSIDRELIKKVLEGKDLSALRKLKDTYDGKYKNPNFIEIIYMATGEKEALGLFGGGLVGKQIKHITEALVAEFEGKPLPEESPNDKMIRQRREMHFFERPDKYTNFIVDIFKDEGRIEDFQFERLEALSLIDRLRREGEYIQEQQLGIIKLIRAFSNHAIQEEFKKQGINPLDKIDKFDYEIEDLREEYDKIQKLLQKVKTERQKYLDPDSQASLQEQINQVASFQKDSLEAYEEAKRDVAEKLALAAGAAVTLATGGAAGALLGGLASMGTKELVLGGSYTRGEFAKDVVNTGINAATMGIAPKLLAGTQGVKGYAADMAFGFASGSISGGINAALDGGSAGDVLKASGMGGLKGSVASVIGRGIGGSEIGGSGRFGTLLSGGLGGTLGALGGTGLEAAAGHGFHINPWEAMNAFVLGVSGARDGLRQHAHAKGAAGGKGHGSPQPHIPEFTPVNPAEANLPPGFTLGPGERLFMYDGTLLLQDASGTLNPISNQPYAVVPQISKSAPPPAAPTPAVEPKVIVSGDVNYQTMMINGAPQWQHVGGGFVPYAGKRGAASPQNAGVSPVDAAPAHSAGTSPSAAPDGALVIPTPSKPIYDGMPAVHDEGVLPSHEQSPSAAANKSLPSETESHPAAAPKDSESSRPVSEEEPLRAPTTSKAKEAGMPAVTDERILARDIHDIKKTNEILENQGLKENFKEPEDMATLVDKTKRRLAEVPTRSVDGQSQSNVLEKLTNDTLLAPEQKERIFKSLARANKQMFDMASGSVSSGEKAQARNNSDPAERKSAIGKLAKRVKDAVQYQKFNKKHTEIEIDRVYEAGLRLKLNAVEMEDAILASIFSDSVKEAGLASLVTHHIKGAEAAVHQLAKEFDPNHPDPQIAAENRARISRIRRIVLEHQASPSAFFSNMIKIVIKQKMTVPADPAAAKAQSEALDSLVKKIADARPKTDSKTGEFDSQNLETQFTDAERELLKLAGLDEWRLPSSKASMAVVVGDSEANYASPEASKIIDIRGPDTPFKDTTVQQSIESVTGKKDAKTGVRTGGTAGEAGSMIEAAGDPNLTAHYEEHRNRLDQAIVRAEGNVEAKIRSIRIDANGQVNQSGVPKEVAQFIVDHNNDPSKIPYWKETKLNYDDPTQVKVAKWIRSTMSGLLRAEHQNF